MAPAERVMKGVMNGWPSVVRRSFPFGGEKERCPLAQTRMKPWKSGGTFEGVLEYLPTFFVGMVFPNRDHFKFYSIPK